MTDRFIRKQMDPAELARPSNLVTHLFDFLIPTRTSEGIYENIESLDIELKRNSAFVSAVLSLFGNLCKGSLTVTNEILKQVPLECSCNVRSPDFSSPKLVLALKVVLNCKDERSINDCLRFIDLLLVLLSEGRSSISKHNTFCNDPSNFEIEALIIE
jgi:hypothetical protein